MFRSLSSGALVLIGLGGLTLLIEGCPLTPGPGGEDGAAAKLVPFESAQELLDYFHQQATQRVRNRSQWGSWGGGATPGAAEDALR